MSELGPYVVVINPTSDGSYPSDLLFSQPDKSPITSLPCIAPVLHKAEETPDVPGTYNTATTHHIYEVGTDATTHYTSEAGTEHHISKAGSGATTHHTSEAGTEHHISKAGSGVTTHHTSEAGSGATTHYIREAETGGTRHYISEAGTGRTTHHVSEAGTGVTRHHISEAGTGCITHRISEARTGRITHPISEPGTGRITHPISEAGTGRITHHISEAGTGRITHPISEAGTGRITHHISEAGTSTNTEGTYEIKVEDVATGRRGIFDKARASSSEMEWTSDESDYITPAETFQGLPRPLFSIECGESFMTLHKQSPPKTYRKKWSEEEHACLMEGVRILGEGKWKEIKNMYREVLKDRDTVHLKDRFRNTEGKRGKRKEILRTKEQETVGNT